MDWAPPPLPVAPCGNVLTMSAGGSVMAFRFGVVQGEKIRSRDDLIYSTTNEFCTVWTGVKLPTWDHIGQMCLEIRDANRPWAFFKMGRESAYKQLPLDQDHAKYDMATIRRPQSWTWFAFPPRALLFGEEADVAHYNCFPRILAVLVSRIFGIPLVSYFDDFWRLRHRT